jgi:hypothetical protein
MHKINAHCQPSPLLMESRRLVRRSPALPQRLIMNANPIKLRVNTRMVIARSPRPQDTTTTNSHANTTTMSHTKDTANETGGIGANENGDRVNRRGGNLFGESCRRVYGTHAGAGIARIMSTHISGREHPLPLSVPNYSVSFRIFAAVRIKVLNSACLSRWAVCLRAIGNPQQCCSRLRMLARFFWRTNPASPPPKGCKFAADATVKSRQILLKQHKSSRI